MQLILINNRLYAGPEVDIWSCGVILYALVCAKLPFDDEYLPNLFMKIRGGHYRIPDYVSPECKSLISAMLEVNPIKRITIPEIRQLSWFQKDLPEYLSYPTNLQLSRVMDIERDSLDELCQKLEVSKEVAIELLSRSDENFSPLQVVLKSLLHLLIYPTFLLFA